MTYSERVDRLHDFLVRYHFLSSEEGGRTSGPPFQGYRCDWAYDGDDIEKTGIYMIWPEFENESSGVILEKQIVPPDGTARMWIVSPELREEIHRARIKVGVKGYFMEGGKKVAEAEVISLVGLDGPET
jgi:hypothetical protein